MVTPGRTSPSSHCLGLGVIALATVMLILVIALLLIVFLHQNQIFPNSMTSYDDTATRESVTFKYMKDTTPGVYIGEPVKPDPTIKPPIEIIEELA